MVGALSHCFIGRKISCIKNTERESQTVGKTEASGVYFNQESQNIIVIIVFFVNQILFHIFIIKSFTNRKLFLGKSCQDRPMITGLAVHMENLCALPALQQWLVGVHIVDMGGESVRGC